MPNGKPTATTWSPGRRPLVERSVAGIRSSGMLLRLQHREVVLGLRADHLGVGLQAVGERDLDALRAVHHVQVGEDDAVVDDHHAGADVAFAAWCRSRRPSTSGMPRTCTTEGRIFRRRRPRSARAASLRATFCTAASTSACGEAACGAGLQSDRGETQGAGPNQRAYCANRATSPAVRPEHRPPRRSATAGPAVDGSPFHARPGNSTARRQANAFSVACRPAVEDRGEPGERVALALREHPPAG